MKTIANEYETLEAIKKAMAMYELKKAPEEKMKLDRKAAEELGKHFVKGFRVGFENIVIGYTQEEIDKMVNALKKEDDE
ncbi:hypothetical protein IOQ88_002872 [Listeria monocytogenes]|nr:hypothetical protein [Listeria monocytogenes]EAC3006460.1 hypothetical protein [Listeria monocytogenes]EAC3520302.1 hypothetical protein [Listeria monocytogenes]EAC3529172.1 hypothetical protein [Listeria monocytogenes]EAC4434517.1 hypothetical protein [Listeria monocytogenes]